MEIDQLKKCPYIDLIDIRGTFVLFNVQLFSEKTGNIERCKIQCPTSGNWLLLESAKVIEGAVVDDIESILGSILETFEKAEQVNQKIETKEITVDPLDQRLQDAAEAYLEDDFSSDKDGALFRYLRKCSDNFNVIYNQYEQPTKEDRDSE